MVHVLVPVDVVEGESVSTGLVELLATVDVTVLGYHVLPEQTPPDQARLQFEERVDEALDGLVQEFRAAGANADARTVFTHDEEQTLDRVADAVDADAYAVTGVTGPVDELLVSLSDTGLVDPVLSFVEAVVGDRDVAITLFLHTDDETAGRALLDSSADRLASAGLEVETVLATGGASIDALVETMAGHGAAVLGERAPSLRSLVLGDEAERVAAASVGPVLVVRHERITDEVEFESDGGSEEDGTEPARSEEHGTEPAGSEEHETEPAGSGADTRTG